MNTIFSFGTACANTPVKVMYCSRQWITTVLLKDKSRIWRLYSSGFSLTVYWANNSLLWIHNRNQRVCQTNTTNIYIWKSLPSSPSSHIYPLSHTASMLNSPFWRLFVWEVTGLKLTVYWNADMGFEDLACPVIGGICVTEGSVNSLCCWVRRITMTLGIITSTHPWLFVLECGMVWIFWAAK